MVASVAPLLHPILSANVPGGALGDWDHGTDVHKPACSAAAPRKRETDRPSTSNGHTATACDGRWERLPLFAASCEPRPLRSGKPHPKISFPLTIFMLADVHGPQRLRSRSRYT